MVERLFNCNPITEDDLGSNEGTITNLINEPSGFNDRSSPVDRATKLPTINENFEGFQFSSSYDQMLPVELGRRTRRNSHPSGFRESQTNRTHSPFSIDPKQLRPPGGRCKSLRDPMLALEVTPKEEHLIFDKHRLDKIDEADSSAEISAEQDFKCRELSNGHREEIMRVQPVRGRLRRGSYPTDVNYARNLKQRVDMSNCSEEEIVSRWMKFF